MCNDLDALAQAVGVLLDPASPEGTGTTIHYLLATLLGLATTTVPELAALLREGGHL